MIKDSSSQDNDHSESSKVASEHPLRETIDNLLDNYYDGNNSIIIPADEDFGNQLLQAFTAAVETVIGEDSPEPKIDPIDNGFNHTTWLANSRLRVMQHKRLAEMVGKTKEGESLE